VTAVNEFDCGLDLRSATYIKYPQAVPLSYTIDREACIGCGLCEKACLAEAIRYDDRPRHTVLEIGAVILALGNETFDPSNLECYSYRASPNVVTSIEFERILSASGPYMGHLMRPYDREEPRKIAWVQCVGSRDRKEGAKTHCSSVCCMYAIKEAVIAKEHAHSPLDTAVFYMDMRTHGKEFEAYYQRAREEHGVRFIRSRIHSVEPVGDGDLKIIYADERGAQHQEIFDLVVLSVGFHTGKDIRETAHRLGVNLDEWDFVETKSFTPVTTSRPGVYVCGTLQGPKDIPQSVMEASAAAAASGALLIESRWTQTQVKEIPPEINIRGERPRIGVFVCHCGINIGGIVDVPAVCEYAKTLPFVVYAEDNLYTCSQDTQVKMAEVIKEQGINRVVVAACTPKTHEPLFQETLQNAGLNRYLFEMANIRNQDSWVHALRPEEATLKAKDLLRMSVAKAALLEPLTEIDLNIHPATLVVGGGIAGLVCAKTIAEQGYDVHVVERSPRLGGQANHLFKTWKNENVQAHLEKLIAEIEKNPKIQTHLSTEITHVDGFVGNFRSVLRSAHGEETNVNHGIAVIATGAKEYKPNEYCYGLDPRVQTHLELDERFVSNDPSLKHIRTAVFIQCVGSRESQRNYCSRVCCTHSIKSALELKNRNSDMNVYVVHRDLRTYGEREALYEQARKQGVLFFRYGPENKPIVSSTTDHLEIQVYDVLLDRFVMIKADLLALASAVVPPQNDALARYFKIPLNGEGFFSEAHAKLRPVDFATDGVFLCGLAHYPKSVDESIAQALAAASRALVLLTAGKISVSGTIAEINPALCSHCGACLSICPFNAPSFCEDGAASINPVLCKGCGLCIASCRSSAIQLKGFDDSQLMAMIEHL
jgi:heterodisulfide reductase subunit A